MHDVGVIFLVIDALILFLSSICLQTKRSTVSTRWSEVPLIENHVTEPLLADFEPASWPKVFRLADKARQRNNSSVRGYGGMELILLRDRSLNIRVQTWRVTHRLCLFFFENLHALYLICFNSPIIHHSSKSDQRRPRGSNTDFRSHILQSAWCIPLLSFSELLIIRSRAAGVLSIRLLCSPFRIVILRAPIYHVLFSRE